MNVIVLFELYNARSPLMRHAAAVKGKHSMCHSGYTLDNPMKLSQHICQHANRCHTHIQMPDAVCAPLHQRAPITLFGLFQVQNDNCYQSGKALQLLMPCAVDDGSDQSLPMGRGSELKSPFFPLLNPSDNNDLHALCISFAILHGPNRV